MTTRANIKITILQVLDRLPAAYTQRVSALRYPPRTAGRACSGLYPCPNWTRTAAASWSACARWTT